MNPITHTDIFDHLYRHYGSQGWWPLLDMLSGRFVYDSAYLDTPLGWDDIYEICIGAILTQNTLWSNVEKALRNLKNHGLIDMKKIRDIAEPELAALIKCAGFQHQKTRKLKAIAASDLTRADRKTLLNIWGIGPETADSILLYAFKKNSFVMDKYSIRIFQRLGLRAIPPRRDLYHFYKTQVESELKATFRIYNEYHALLVKLGKMHCGAVKKCARCPLLSRCESSDQADSVAGSIT